MTMSIKSISKSIWKVISKQGAVLAILALMILMLFFNTNFYTAYNWLICCDLLPFWKSLHLVSPLPVYLRCL